MKTQNGEAGGLFSGISVHKKECNGDIGLSHSVPLLSKTHNETGFSYGSRNDDNEDGSLPTTPPPEKAMENASPFCLVMKNLKLLVLSGVLIFCVVALSFIKVRTVGWKSFAVVSGKPIFINATSDGVHRTENVRLNVRGPFLPVEYYSVSDDFVTFSLSKITANGTYIPISLPWKVLLAPTTSKNEENSPLLEHEFRLSEEEISKSKNYQLTVDTNKNDLVALAANICVVPQMAVNQIIMALCILIGLYVLIIFELVHRTLAALLGATVAISCLAFVGKRPSLMEVLTWVDVETLSLLFGMMVLVSILCQTGFFEYVAVLTYKLARGNVWHVITGLCLVTSLLSALLDNVTTMLLMSAVAIRLCETMNINPKHIIMALAVFSNIGGAMTPIGDPPNVIIISNNQIKHAGLDFSTFTLHMFPVALICLLAAYAVLRFIYRDMFTLRYSDPPEVVDLQHEIEVWKRAYYTLPGYSRDEDAVRKALHSKIVVLQRLLKKKQSNPTITEDVYSSKLQELKDAFQVKDKALLIKSVVTIGVVIVFFFLESFLNLSIGWIAILGAIFLLLLADFDELESVFSRVEWTTLLFFAALFVVMEALARLELVLYIVDLTKDAINSVGEQNRLTMAIILILWISAFSSSIIDNIPFTTVMVHVVVDIADNEGIQLPLQPLVFALALGACLGGNGTLIGSSANVVAAGLAEQHGYRFSFFDFFKIGFPIMILTTAISTGYLLFCHVLLGWNG